MKRSGIVVLAIGLVAAGGWPAGAVTGDRSVVVPHVVGQDVTAAYRRLHDAGLRISVRRPIHIGFVFASLAVSVYPAPGIEVGRGSVVVLKVGCPHCGAASVAAPNKQPVYRVPDFAGQSATSAYHWIRHKALLFEANLGPLRAAAAPTLFANYRVTRQSPAPGTMLRLHTGPAFAPTPLSISATQRR